MTNKNLTTLTFIVSGEETTVDKVNFNQPLRVAVQKALNQTGNTGRTITDWQVKFEETNLNLSKKVEEFDFPANAEIFVSLKAGQGGI